MRAVIIDDEYYACEELEYLLKETQIDVIGAFTDPQQGFDVIIEQKPDLVFLDIDLPKTTGIELALHIQTQLSHIAIVFTTAHSEYALDAYKAYPIDYILKPIQEERLQKTISRIQESLNTQLQKMPQNCHIRLFGKYGVECENRSIKFQTKKTFELLAYLLCNADVHIVRNELVRMLFGDDDLTKGVNNLYVTMFRLRKDLTSIGLDKNHVLIRENYSVEIKDGMCDFTDFYRFITKYSSINQHNVKEAEKIINLISGSLLSGLDWEWVLEIREWAQIKAEELISQTALYYANINQTNHAEELLQKLLNINPLSEGGYQKLLDIYIDTNQLGKFMFYYEKYIEFMQNELNCTPEKRYTWIADKIWQENLK